MRYHTLLPAVGAATLVAAVVIFVSALRADRDHLEPTMGEYPESFLRWNATRLVDCRDDVVRQATNWWTKQVCPRAVRCSEFLFSNVLRDDSYGVLNDIVLAQDDRAGIAFDPRGAGKVTYWIPSPGTIDEEFRIVIHEIGHALGLAHDPGQSFSPMYPAIQPGKPLLLSQADREALRGTFCP